MKKRLMTILLIITVGIMSGCAAGTDAGSDNANDKQKTEINAQEQASADKMEQNELAESSETSGNSETTDRNETDTDNGNVENSGEKETVQSNQTTGNNETGDHNETVGDNETSGNNGTVGNNEKAADGENAEGTDSGSQNSYEVCTSIPKAEVEAFAGQVKQQIVSQNWKGLSENISYPITVGDTTYQNSEEFAAGDFSESLSQKFIDAVEAETCTDMFCSWQGIMMGNGEVWISEVLNDDASSQGLKVTAINGMVE